MAQENHYSVEYRLEQEHHLAASYTVEIDKESLVSRIASPEPWPEWTKLDREKCTQCPLANTDHCPIAVRLVEPIRRFGGLLSHTKVNTTVTTPERTYVKLVDAQDALRSLFGLVMATSGCPLMAPFKYMARYHLPFASLEETIARITSTYLMRELYKYPGPKEKNIHIDLGEIEALYTTMQSLNEGMARRLKSVGEGDGTLNAIVILNTYSSLIPIILEDELQKLKPLFG